MVATIACLSWFCFVTSIYIVCKAQSLAAWRHAGAAPQSLREFPSILPMSFGSSMLLFGRLVPNFVSIPIGVRPLVPLLLGLFLHGRCLLRNGSWQKEEGHRVVIGQVRHQVVQGSNPSWRWFDPSSAQLLQPPNACLSARRSWVRFGFEKPGGGGCLKV